MDEKIYDLLTGIQQEIRNLPAELADLRSEMQTIYSELKGTGGVLLQQMEERGTALAEFAETWQEHCETQKQHMEKVDEELKRLEESKLDKNALKRIG